MANMITGTAYYAFVTEPNTNFKDHVWSINVCDLDKESMKTVVEDGLILKPSNDNHPTDYVIIKQKVYKKDGGKFNAPGVLDASKEPWDDRKIGNGSKVRVLYTPRAWTVAGNEGVTADLKMVQVLDLVPYVDASSNDEFNVEEGGYVIPPQPKDAFASN